MTSEQQIKNMFGKDNVYVYSLHYHIEEEYYFKVMVKAYVIDNWYCIGLSHSRYKAFSNALHNMGGKRISGSGKYQKDKL